MQPTKKQSNLHGFYPSVGSSRKRTADAPAQPAQPHSLFASATSVIAPPAAGPSLSAFPGSASAPRRTTATPSTPPSDAIKKLSSGKKLGSPDSDKAAALADHVAARSTSKVDFIPRNELVMTPAAYAAQQLVTGQLFPSQLPLFSLEYCAGIIDADGGGYISYSEKYDTVGFTVMCAQSNPALLSNMAHSFHAHGIDIEHASLHKVEDPFTGRYVHGNKVHLLMYRGPAAARLAALLQPLSGMKSKQLQLIASKQPQLASLSPSARKDLAAECRRLNAGQHLEENLNKAALYDAQGRPCWAYFTGIWEGDGTAGIQNDAKRAGLFLALSQPKSLAWLNAIKEAFGIGKVQPGGASENASLQIRHREDITTFLRFYIPNGHLKLQKVLMLTIKMFRVSLAALTRMVNLPQHKPDPAPLGFSKGAYSVKKKQSTRTAAEQKRLKEKAHFLASQWATLLADPSHRAAWSH